MVHLCNYNIPVHRNTPGGILMMEKLRGVLRWIESLCAPDGANVRGAASGAGAASAHEAAQEAARELFSPRHSLQQEVRFGAVDASDQVLKKGENFYPDGGGFREVHTETRVITTPGPIVQPEAVVLKCSACGGFDCEARFCKCGRGLCRLCKRELIMPDGLLQTFCPEHYREALRRFDTWRAYDERRRNERPPI